MTGRALILTSLLVGCGRIRFDELDQPAVTDAALDATLACTAPPCAGAATSMLCGQRCFVTCDELLDQPTVTARCSAWGGTIASIRSPQELTCLASLQANDVWIGYVQASGALTPTDGWMWLDGATSTITNWAIGEPNDLDGTESGEEGCAMMYAPSGEWNDGICSDMKAGMACAK